MKTTIAAVVLASVLLAQPAKEQNIALQAAIRKETVDGDLQGAIKLYGAIVAKYPRDRAVAAMALVHMAECYQKLGDTESRKIYQRLVRDYADQKEAIALARVRLGRLEPTAHAGGMSSRRVWAGANFVTSSSSDGRYLAFMDQKSRNLGIHDFATGADRLLTHAETPEDWAGDSAFSRDGKQVAYSWASQHGRYELRLVNVEGVPSPRRLSVKEEVEWITPSDWSPDGKWIAAEIGRKDGTAQFGLVGVQDGSLRILRSVVSGLSSRLLFSPDGKYLAFDYPPSESSKKRDVFVLAIEGGREIPAVVDPNQNRVTGWSPDGRLLLFASDRSGSMGLWALPFVDGKPQGEPQLLKPDVGRLSPLGVSPSGTLYMRVSASDRDLEVASIDLDAGKLLTPFMRRVKSFVGSNYMPSWSSDSQYLTFVSSRGREDVLAILSVDTGEVRELRPNLAYFRWPTLAPDGRSLAVWATDRDDREVIYLVDAQSAAAVPIARAEGHGEFGWPLWSPDGKKIYYQSRPSPDVWTFLEKDLESGKEREIIRGAGLGWLHLSPDGRFLATPRVDPSTKATAVLLIPVDGGEPRELLHADHPQGVIVTDFTPDGRGLIVNKALSGEAKEAWLIPIAGGEQSRLEFSAFLVRLSPDGHQVVRYRYLPNNEVWALENFLPAASKGK